jgi:hypothetical protein
VNCEQSVEVEGEEASHYPNAERTRDRGRPGRFPESTSVPGPGSQSEEGYNEQALTRVS